MAAHHPTIAANPSVIGAVVFIPPWRALSHLPPARRSVGALRDDNSGTTTRRPRERSKWQELPQIRSAIGAWISHATRLEAGRGARPSNAKALRRCGNRVGDALDRHVAYRADGPRGAHRLSRGVGLSSVVDAADIKRLRAINRQHQRHPRRATLALDIGCAELALHLNAGRAKFRETDTANSQARAALRDAFGENYRPSQCGLLAVHDDCVARHVHGLPPSESVDMSLCELSSRETAREVRAAMRHTEVNDDTRRTNAYAARLAAGRLMQIIGAHISECRAAPPGPGEGPRLLLLSGHDTSLMAVANALEHLASDAPPSGPRCPTTCGRRTRRA